MASASGEPVSTLPPLVLEAQRLMTLSVNKIVASRSRKGGVSLHRNLLVAGVLFRARDALLAAGGKMMSQSPSPPSTVSSASPGKSPSSETTQQQQNHEPTPNDTCRTSSIPSSPPPSADCPTPSAEMSIVSSVAETKPCPHREVSVDTDDSQMDVEFVGKENVPPTTATPSPSTSELAKSSSPETETTMTSDKSVPPSQQGAPVSRKRSQSGSSTSCPIVEKSSRVVLSSESSFEDDRSSSIPVCVGHSSSKVVASAASSSRQSSSSSSQSCSSSSLNSRSSISVVNPVVYVNRVDVAFCSTSGIGGGVIGQIRPVYVVQVV